MLSFLIDKAIFAMSFLGMLNFNCSAPQETTSIQTTEIKTENTSTRIIPAAERTKEYLPMLKGKRVAVFANHTSRVGNAHLVDTLKKSGVNVKIIFGPEHGFRGTAADGAKVDNFIDAATGIPVLSLYGKKLKPSKEDLKNVDILLFDIQDVGTRFYTFISSLQYYMEAALESNLPLVVLDRPNPNGFYVDGPVLEEAHKSFVGMQPVPIVYGMTMGEYAQMILQEGWLAKEANEAYQKIIVSRYPEGARFFQLHIIQNENYTHKSKYVLPVKPSPNLPEIQSIYVYPFTCLFEGTVLSEGRGTAKPFQIFGHPSLPKTLPYSFTPQPNEGAPKPKNGGVVNYGWNLHDTPENVLKLVDNKVQLRWLLEAYQLFPEKKTFFIGSFNRLAGNATLQEQIKAGKSEAEIRKSWEPKLNAFKQIRKKYLLYEDFE